MIYLPNLRNKCSGPSSVVSPLLAELKNMFLDSAPPATTSILAHICLILSFKLIDKFSMKMIFDVYLSGTKGRMSGLQTTAVSMLMLLLSTIMELIMIVVRKKIIVIPATFFIIINTRMESFIKEI